MTNEHLQTYAPDSVNYDILSCAAIMMTHMDTNNNRYFVQDTYFDFGQDWLYTTIIKENLNETSQILRTSQALCPNDQKTLLNDGFEKIYENVQKYFTKGHMYS